MEPFLSPIDLQRETLVRRTIDWANIPSHTYDLEGLEKMSHALIHEFSGLGGEIEILPSVPSLMVDDRGNQIPLLFGNSVSIRKRITAPKQVLLAGHMDTVYPREMGFLFCEREGNILKGPGVVDMKGGLAILLSALEAFETSPYKENVGWEVLINADEEVGSPGSCRLFVDRAKKFDVGLLFEPAFPDGSIVLERKGSLAYTITVRGKSAHAGRDFFTGKSAVAALSEILAALHVLNDPAKGITLNLGYITGGGPINVVPDFALCKINIRAFTQEDLDATVKKLQELVDSITLRHGVAGQVLCDTARAPKPETPELRELYETFKRLGASLGIELGAVMSGGVCDGNILAGEGLPNLDTLGAVGGNMHTTDEYLLIDSLTQRAKLTALFLMEFSHV